jgi:hypothetical protein
VTPFHKISQHARNSDYCKTMTPFRGLEGLCEGKKANLARQSLTAGNMGGQIIIKG